MGNQLMNYFQNGNAGYSGYTTPVVNNGGYTQPMTGGGVGDIGAWG